MCICDHLFINVLQCIVIWLIKNVVATYDQIQRTRTKKKHKNMNVSSGPPIAKKINYKHLCIYFYSGFRKNAKIKGCNSGKISRG